MKTRVITSYHAVAVADADAIPNAPPAILNDVATPSDAMLVLLVLKHKAGMKFARLMHCLD